MAADLFSVRTLIKKVKEHEGQENDVGLLSLLLSALVYFSDEFAEKVLIDIGIDPLDFYLEENADGFKYLYVNHKLNQYVAFRGTLFSMWSNTKRVLNFIPKKSSTGIKMHRGFLMAFEDCNETLQDLIVREKPVIFTGHSLGGALALISAEFYGESAITFAAPNVFFNEKMDSKIDHLGYKMKGDIVPQIPPATFFMNWIRVKFEFLLKSKKKFVIPTRYHALGLYITTILDRYETFKIKTK